jgi:hypothetical protein
MSSVFLLGATENSGAVPPNAASLLEEALWIKASNPICTSLVFSSTPVKALALAIKSSSKIMVVLMHLYMHYFMPFVNHIDMHIFVLRRAIISGRTKQGQNATSSFAPRIL